MSDANPQARKMGLGAGYPRSSMYFQPAFTGISFSASIDDEWLVGEEGLEPSSPKEGSRF